MMAQASTEAANAVLLHITGYRTKEQVICEFFGVKPEDLGKTVKLKRAGVRFHPRLAKLGVTLETFKEMFDDTLELDEAGNPIENGAVKLESGAGEERGDDHDGIVGVEAPVKPLVRRKKGGAQEVPGAESGAQ